MNLERRIAKLNRTFEERLGSLLKYSWRQAETLIYPAIEMDSDARDLTEMVCACGIDVTIHSPYCRSLSVARKKVALRRILEGAQWDHRWVVCMHYFPDKDNWVAQYGTHVNYPDGGVWFPITQTLGNSGGHIKTAKGVEPTLAATEKVIEWISESRSVPAIVHTKQYEATEAKKELDHVDRLYNQIRDVTNASKLLNHIPGKKGHSSFATPTHTPAHTPLPPPQ